MPHANVDAKRLTRYSLILEFINNLVYYFNVEDILRMSKFNSVLIDLYSVAVTLDVIADGDLYFRMTAATLPRRVFDNVELGDRPAD